jgi:carbon-monoxide dehydrogenase large subunit
MRAQGRLVGLGLAMYVEVCGLGPSASLPTGGWEHSQVTIERDGRISATTGASPHGQGNETTFAQMLADQFSVPFEHVTILHGDTGVVKQGIGTFGSRSQAVGGTRCTWPAQGARPRWPSSPRRCSKRARTTRLRERPHLRQGRSAQGKSFAERRRFAYIRCRCRRARAG